MFPSGPKSSSTIQWDLRQTFSRSRDPEVNKILFLCTGNYYRSRYAEILFNSLAEQRGLEWTAESRGLQPDPRNMGPLSRHTVAALERQNICFDNHMRLPLRVTGADFRAAQHIVALKEAEHRAMIERDYPEWTDRVEFWHVHDLDCAEPEEALPELERQMERLVDRLAADSLLQQEV